MSFQEPAKAKPSPRSEGCGAMHLLLARMLTAVEQTRCRLLGMSAGEACENVEAVDLSSN